MNNKVPENILSGLDKVLSKLNEYKSIKEYKFLIGNPKGAHLSDYDDSQWTNSTGPVRYERHQGTTWFKFEVKIPEKVLDIPVEGAGIRLSSFFIAPFNIYIDGSLKFSEHTWMDFKIPEIILTGKAIPGQVFKAAAKMELGEFCYIPGIFSMNYIIDRVEDAEFEIRSFREELAFACRFKEVSDVLPQVFDVIDGSLENSEGVLKLLEKIRLCREMLRPMEAAAKKKKVHLIGHAHIDMDWIWSIDETRDVVRRDFGTMTAFMEEFPDFRFSQSQCATYEMTEKLFPAIFERMKKQIGAGNWDVTASTWVEGDMNMASGESIVRHLLYSKKYLRDKFGVEPRIMWCPDTFGHSGNLPQIARKAGIDYYFFMRCGKESRKLGADSVIFSQYGPEKPLFWWEGIDGSKLLAFNAVYNADVNTTSVCNIAGRLEDEYGLDNSMFVYGTGDHGGGPTRRDIKRAKLLNSFPTTPRIEFSTTHSFFDSVVKENLQSISTEKGELNYVFDGCYTTHADIKRYNRKCENMLASTEVLATAGMLHGMDYRRQDIDECWKTTLFNQFHDIFDGSGVKATYAYASEIAGKALDTLGTITDYYLKAIGSKIKPAGKGSPVILFNTTGWERSECIRIGLPDGVMECRGVTDTEGNRLPTQLSDGWLYIFVHGIPAMGYKVIYLEKTRCGEGHSEKEEYVNGEPIKDEPADTESVNNECMPLFSGIIENGDYFEIESKYYWIEIKKNSGEITTLFDKVNDRYVVRREQIGWKLKNGSLNTLQIHYEVPTAMSSWTIGPPSMIKCLVSGAVTTIKSDGPVVKVINFRHQTGNSVISQDIAIYNDSPRIDFITSVDWKETGGSDKDAPMLKACFVPDISNTHVTCEIPFGTMDRPCRDNEIPALNWIDISDKGYGLGLLNDCKYGHKVKGNSMEITLIRSGWEPDPQSDVGTHEFIYSILPHKGNWNECGIINEGHCLNRSIIYRFIDTDGTGDLPDTYSFVKINGSNIVITAFKPAEEGRGLILRLYNSNPFPVKAKAELGFRVREIHEVDLNEIKTYGEFKTNDTNFEFSMDAYEIKTFKFLDV